MSSSRDPAPPEGDWPARYTISVRGHLSPGWSEWFLGLTFNPTQSGDTILTGTIQDQAALHGLLEHIRDLNLTLIGVRRHESDAPSGGRVEEDA